MRLPNGDRAIVRRSKIVDYALNPNHPNGANKARVFRAKFGLTVADADALTTWLREMARDADAQEQPPSAYGRRFAIDAVFCYNGVEGLVRSSCILRDGEVAPSLTSVRVV